jgi:hypothetical protein
MALVMDVQMSVKRLWNDNNRGKRSTGTECSPSATMSTTNPTRTYRVSISSLTESFKHCDTDIFVRMHRRL